MVIRVGLSNPWVTVAPVTTGPAAPDGPAVTVETEAVRVIVATGSFDLRVEGDSVVVTSTTAGAVKVQYRS